MEHKFDLKKIKDHYIQLLKNHQTLEYSSKEKDVLLDGLLKVIQMFA